MYFLVILAVVAAVGLVSMYVGNAPARAVGAKEKVREARLEESAARNREAIATNALLAIRNGSGSPELEAQIALDEINNTYTKEIQ